MNPHGETFNGSLQEASDASSEQGPDFSVGFLSCSLPRRTRYAGCGLAHAASAILRARRLADTFARTSAQYVQPKGKLQYNTCHLRWMNRSWPTRPFTCSTLPATTYNILRAGLDGFHLFSLSSQSHLRAWPSTVQLSGYGILISGCCNHQHPRMENGAMGFTTHESMLGLPLLLRKRNGVMGDISSTCTTRSILRASFCEAVALFMPDTPMNDGELRRPTGMIRGSVGILQDMARRLCSKVDRCI